MAAESNSTYDVFLWIKKVINSCKKPEQLSSSDNLCDIFLAKLDRENNPLSLKYRMELDSEFLKKAEELFNGESSAVVVQ